MKKTILIIVFAGMICHILAQKSFYEQVKETDSILSIYLERDTNVVYRAIDSLAIYNNVFLVFENKSSDSIVLSSNFENFDGVCEYRSGILMHFYFNHKLGMLSWGELRPKFFNFSNGKTPIPPHSKVRFEIPLPSMVNKKDKEEGIEFEIFYRYINKTKKNISFFKIKTAYLKLDYDE